MPADAYSLLRAVFAAICCAADEPALDGFPGWVAMRPMPLDKPWPDAPAPS
jgi:hypothetical protein